MIKLSVIQDEAGPRKERDSDSASVFSLARDNAKRGELLERVASDKPDEPGDFEL